MTITTIPKIKYLTNKDLLKEIHLSKNTYCTFSQPEYSDYDLIIPNLEKINIRTIAEAKRNRASKLSKKAHEAAVIAGGKKLSAKEFEIDYKKTGKKGIGFYLLPKKIIDRMINIELKPNNDKKHITTIYAIFDGFLDKKEEEKVNHIEENQDEIIEKIEIDEDKL